MNLCFELAERKFSKRKNTPVSGEHQGATVTFRRLTIGAQTGVLPTGWYQTPA
jgi:hypothetical protein